MFALNLFRIPTLETILARYLALDQEAYSKCFASLDLIAPFPPVARCDRPIPSDKELRLFEACCQAVAANAVLQQSHPPEPHTAFCTTVLQTHQTPR